MKIPSGSKALLLVDIQPDFMPGGGLAVPGGDEILEPAGRLMSSQEFDLLVATQDWHPRNHISFASQHPGHIIFDVISLYGEDQVLWPDHCVQGTAGAALHTGLNWDPVSAIVRKGMDPAVDSYSAFRNNWDAEGTRPETGLAGYLRERGITDVYLCGLARDYCVKWSAEDAAEAGFNVTVIWDATRPVDPSSDEQVRSDLTSRWIRILQASDIS